MNAPTLKEFRKELGKLKEGTDVCHNCEGGGRMWADGQAHYATHKGETVACGHCGGSGRTIGEDCIEIIDGLLDRLTDLAISTKEEWEKQWRGLHLASRRFYKADAAYRDEPSVGKRDEMVAARSDFDQSFFKLEALEEIKRSSDDRNREESK